MPRRPRSFARLTLSTAAPRSQTGRQRHSASAVAPSAASVAAAQQELSVLEARFVDACIRSTESKDARMIDLEARFLHSHDVVSTPAIDAFIMQSCQPLWDPDGVRSGGAPARAYAPAPTLEPLPPPDEPRRAPPPAAPPPRAAAPPSFPPEPPSFPPARPPAAAPPRPAHHRVDAWPADARGVFEAPRPAPRAAPPPPARAAPPAMRAAPDPRAPHAAGHAAYAAPRRGPLAPQPYRDPRAAAPPRPRAPRPRPAAPQPRAAPPAPAARPAGDTVPANLLLGFVQSLHRSDSHSELVDFVEDVRTKTDR